MLNLIKGLRDDESGAVTVDFVVLTAAIVVLGLVVGTIIATGAESLANEVEDAMGNSQDNLITEQGGTPDA